MELERLQAKIAASIQHEFDLLTFKTGEYSLWLKFIRLAVQDGARVEETVGPIRKLVISPHSPAELFSQLAEQVVLTVFGSEAQIVTEMPNLIVKLWDHKVRIHAEGAPALESPGQIWLKATLYRKGDGLWAMLFRGD